MRQMFKEILAIEVKNIIDIELNKIYNMDCLDGMKYIDSESVDLIITDPPYLMNYKSNRRTKSEKFDYIENDIDSEQMIRDFFEESSRILKDNTAIYVFCSWHHIDFFKHEFEKYFKLKNIIVWNKNNHGTGDLKGSYAPKHEFVLFGHKGRTLLKGKRVPDVIDCAKVPSKKLTHPTEKPIELLDIFIQNSSVENDIVLDGFVGTASLALSCIKNNRKYIGFEIDKKYYDIATDRIAKIS